ncbi:MAG: galactose-1-phosphate uridylyltransferase [Candidatus Berkelbacteria bacterium]|nr:galactose-1-phosphate uridylyltransferase [Candidatus Berkelbacteria bacterium]
MPQLRQNIITGDWVVVAPERAKRPKDFLIPKSMTIADKTKCPFCVGTAGYEENKKNLEYQTPHIYVIENRFPAFLETETQKSIRTFFPEGTDFYRIKPSLGDHEVVVVEDHDLPLFKMPKLILTELFEVIRTRYLKIKGHKGIASIMPIYNHGGEAGASIDHPHAQIFASGIVANTVGRELDGADKYYGENGACIYCDMIKYEMKEKVRITYQNEDFIAINFFASRFPFETWIMPKKHESQFEETSKSSMANFAEAVCKVLSMLDKTLDNPPLNFYIHTLPTIFSGSASYHWHMEIVPRVSRYGGFELGSEIIINTMPPEEAAHYLKESQN